MGNPADSTCPLCCSWKFSVAVAAALLLGLLGYCLAQGRLPDPSGEVELLFPQKSLTLSWLDRERAIFEDVYTDTIAIKTSAADSFVLEELQEELLALEGVESVIYPQGNSNSDIFGLYSSDQQYLRFILKISSLVPEDERKLLNQQIGDVLEDYSELAPIRAGSFVTTQEVSAAVNAETRRVTPWIIALLFVVAVILFRSLSTTLIVLGSTLAALGTSILTFSALGYPLGPVSQLAPPFLLAVGTSFHLHFASRILSTAAEQRPGVVRELRWSIALAALTTTTSVATLAFLDVADVTRFAMVAGLGTLLQAAYACTFPPMLLDVFSRKLVKLPQIRLKYLYRSINKYAVYFAIALSIVLAIGISRLEVHTDPLSFLPADSGALNQINTVNRIFPGNHYLSLLLEAIEGTQEKTFFENLKGKLEALESVERVITPQDFETRIDRKGVSDFISDFSVRDSLVPAEFYSTADNAYRILIETKSEGRELIALRDSVRSVVSTIPESGKYNSGITSLELIMAEQTDNIVRGLLQSLMLAISIVCLLLILIFRKLKIALIGIVPNVIPLMSVFGVLGFTLKDLDFGSCLVAASALGIAVDNTFHFLLCWRNESLNSDSLQLATKRSIELTALPFIMTSGSLVAAFSMMALARSLPVAHFGILLAITLLIGLFADLVVLPFLLAEGKKL